MKLYLFIIIIIICFWKRGGVAMIDLKIVFVLFNPMVVEVFGLGPFIDHDIIAIVYCHAQVPNSKPLFCCSMYEEVSVSDRILFDKA